MNQHYPDKRQLVKALLDTNPFTSPEAAARTMERAANALLDMPSATRATPKDRIDAGAEALDRFLTDRGYTIGGATLLAATIAVLDAASSTEGAKCHVCGKPATGVCPEDAGPAGSHGAPLCDTCRCSCGGNPLNPTSTVNAVERTYYAWVPNLQEAEQNGDAMVEIRMTPAEGFAALSALSHVVAKDASATNDLKGD